MDADTLLADAAGRWRLSLEAANKAPRTIETYTASLDLLRGWLERSAPEARLGDVRPVDVEAFIADQLARNKSSTASVRYRSLRTFFNWAVRTGALADSPMRTLTPPIVPDAPVPVVTDEEMRRLLDTSAGRSFEDRRDAAILRLLFDTGIRRAELATLRIDDIDLDARIARVLGKGRLSRVVPFGVGTAQALDRYLRVRRNHALAITSALWLGLGGRTFSDQGVRQMLERRGAQAGVKGLHAHRFRHGFAHNYLAYGGQEHDLMQLTGWRSREMLARYAASTAAERARANYRRPGDRL